MLRTMLERRNLIIAGLAVILILFHAVPFLGQTMPKVWPDEISYLSQAKFIAGKSSTPGIKSFMLSDADYDTVNDKDTDGLPYYHFGYSLLVSPAYLVTDNPEYSYKVVIAINSLLMSSLFLILYFWIRQISSLSENKAIIIALLASLYPSYNLQTHIGWSENALIPFYALSVLFLTSYLKNRRLLYLILFSITSGYLYTIHPRGITGSIAGIICLFLLIVVDRKRSPLGLLGILIIVSILAVTRYVAGSLSELMGAVSQGDTVLGNIRGLINFNFLLRLAGHTLYLTLGTIGVFVFGAIYFLKNIHSTPSFGIKERLGGFSCLSFVYVYILISSALLAFAGVIFLSTDYGPYNYSIDNYLYGRYNEAFLSVYLAGGFIFLTDSGNFKNSRIYNFSFLILILICASFVWSLTNVLSEFRAMRALHSSALFPWYLLSFSFDGAIQLLGIFTGPLLWIWIMYQSRFKSRKRAFIIIGSYFLCMTASMVVFNSS